MESDWMERFDASIYNAVSTDQLRGLRDRMHIELRPSRFADPVEWNRSVNAAHDRLIAGTIELAEQTLRLEGYGTPPVPYAFIAVGSAGRKEQTLWSDQDNGIVYADPPESAKETVGIYFGLLSERVHGWLKAAGYPPCPGRVLCSNPEWRKPLSSWLAQIRLWAEEPEWENVRYLLMMADIRALYGDERLVRAIAGELQAVLKRTPSLLGPMLHNTLHHKMTLGAFGNLITERYGEDAGLFDVKYGAYIPLVNGIRLLALAAGISESSTLGRLRQLAAGGHVESAHADRWEEAFVIALELRSLARHEQGEGMYSTRGMIVPEGNHRKRLKRCLRTGIGLQQTVRRTVERAGGGTVGKRGGPA